MRTMRQIAQFLFLLVILSSNSGCASIAESLMDSAISAAFGESSEERRDRETMESYRQSWSTPGRTAAEVETEARGTFNKVHGRDPKTNWHAR